MTIGPFSFAPGLLVALLVLAAGIGVGNLLATRAGVRVERLLWACAAVALVAGRAAFVGRWWDVYSGQPLQALNLRDGGFDAIAAAAAALACGALLARRRRLARRPLLAGLAAALLAWGVGHAGMALREPVGSLPALALADARGARVDLASLAGEPVVLNLWASWCPPCRREMPLLAQAQHDYPGVRFVFVNQGEDAATVQAYLGKNTVKLDRLLLDPQGSLARITHSPGLPTTLFFDARGRLVERRIGEVSAATLAAHLKKAGAPLTPR